ncbi:hypothetical protein IWW49_005851 [Coemansia sp. RSA 1797]|nr:hypothetical protein IWW49_005851 [Coemansia sp. RSA 1797]
MVLRLVISRKHNLYSMFAANPTSGGGFGFSPRNIGTLLVLWLLLLVLLLGRTVGNALSATSLNLFVANIAPSAATLGVFNGVQQLCTTFMRIIGLVLSGTLWEWSIKHSLVYPFNSHLAWVVCGLVTATAWRLSLRLPDSVNIYLPGKNQRNRR